MKKTVANPAQRRQSREQASFRRPPRILPARLRNQLVPLHQALRNAIPALSGAEPLSSSVMDEHFRVAMSASNPQDAKTAYLEANILKRYQGTDLSNPETRLNNALEALLDSEVKCRMSNIVFAGGLDRSNAHIPLHILPILLRARRIMGEILGPFRIEALPNACNFSSGASTEFPKKRAALHHKWARAAHVTRRAMPYADAFLRWSNLPGIDRELILENRNSVFTVPKNFERDRTACRPVTWNSFLQKGVGQMIKRRLQASEGLLLPDAQDYHRVLAKIGSATGLLATRDLKGASDSISLGLAECLTPPDWLRVLFDTREESGTLPSGELIHWEKVSSMGNGYTFEYETALFYALTRACCSKESLVSVYGDDILLPSRYSEQLDEILSFCGFEVNREKSFSTGSFRESCGGHYFGGVDVKPFYIQHMPKTLGDVINLHNDVVRWCGGKPSPDSRWFETWRACRQIVPRSYWGPCSLQGTLWCEWDEARPRYRPEYQAFAVAATTREIKTTTDLSGRVDNDGNIVESACLGAYFSKLWMDNPDPYGSSVTSHYRETGDVEGTTWLYVDRIQWTRLTAEMLCN